MPTTLDWYMKHVFPMERKVFNAVRPLANRVSPVELPSDKYFGNIKTANFAIAGDTTQGVLWGLKNGEGQGFQPKAVMLMIGTNNSGQSTAPEIALAASRIRSTVVATLPIEAAT